MLIHFIALMRGIAYPSLRLLLRVKLMVSARSLRFWRERLKAIRCAVGLGLLKAGDTETEVSYKA